MYVTATKITYMEKAISKMGQACAEAKIKGLPESAKTINITHPSNPDRIVEVMSIEPTINYIVMHLAPKLLNSSWRLIRAGLKIYTVSLGRRDGLSDDKIKEIIGLMYKKCWKTKSEKKESKEPLSTSSQRKKFISEDEFHSIAKFINMKKRKWGGPMLLWMYAGALTGLRPIEWKTAEEVVHNDKISLKVTNAKNDDIRGIGVHRYIDISTLPSKQIDIIRNHLAISSEFRKHDMWDEYYYGCRKTLLHANKHVFKRNLYNIQLYSSRHQFSADIKLSEMSASERSVLLGHNTTMTQHQWYGQRRTGKSKVLPRNGEPSMENDVKEGYEIKQNKRAALSLKKEIENK